MKRKLVLTLMRLAIVGVVLYAGALVFAGPVRLAYWHATGQAPLLTWSEALQAKTNSLNQLAAKARIAAGARVLQRDGALSLVETEQGPFWMPHRDRDSVYLALSEQSRDLYGKVPAGSVVLDCGAHVGVYTRRALRDGAAKVISIEPVPETLECLRRNFRKEIAEGRVTVYGKGVWDKNSTLPLTLSKDSTAANSFARDVDGYGTVELPLTTIDNIVRDLHLSRVDLIKMDIEGAERQALAGARQTIRNFRPRLEICTYHLIDDPEVITGIISSYGYYRQTHASVFTTRIVHEVTHATAN